MPYPESLKALYKKVEATRPERVARKKAGNEFDALSLAGRAERLSKYHPDHKAESRTAIRVGPNKGYEISPEIVKLLEAKSRIDPTKVKLEPTHETDVLVIGGGGGGTSAAIIAANAGLNVIIATKLRHGDANTMMAEGGIQAATKASKDSPYYHYLDVMGGGHFSNVPELVEALVIEAPKVMVWLEELGAMFDKFPDGRMRTLHGGGTCRKRMHSAGDISGAEIMRTLRDEARSYPELIKVLEFAPAVELVLDESGVCCGAIIYDLETEEYHYIKAKATVMATGGSGRLHMMGFMTTNHYGATADGLVMAYRTGVPLCFLHAVQYHPTGCIFPEQLLGLLITEKFRGAGANVCNVEGEQFVYEREPRDVEAASFIRECTDIGKGVPTPTGKFAVWLDSPMIDDLHGKGFVEKNFPGKFVQFGRHGIDISKEPMLVYPTLHYQNGGIEIKANSSTCVKGLFGAGEVNGGIHGENRLMGNSLLDVTVFGRIAGRAVAHYVKEEYEETGKPTLEHVTKYNKELKEAGLYDEAQIAPMLLPDYSNPEVRERQLTSSYLGTLR